MKGAIRIYVVFVIIVLIASAFFIAVPLTVTGPQQDIVDVQAGGERLCYLVGELHSTTYEFTPEDDIKLDRWEFEYHSTTVVIQFAFSVHYSVKWFVNDQLKIITHPDTELIAGIGTGSVRELFLTEYPRQIPDLGILHENDIVDAYVIVKVNGWAIVSNTFIEIHKAYRCGSSRMIIIASPEPPPDPEPDPPEDDNPPIAEFRVNRQNFPSAPTYIKCYGEATDPEDGVLPHTAYYWTFGDGGAIDGQITPTYYYRIEGNYALTCTVTDSDGNKADKTIGIIVGTSDPDPDPDPPPKADLFGNVYDADNNLPINDAKVTLDTGIRRNTDSTGYFIFQDMNKEAIYLAEVFADGDYIIANVGLVPDVQNDIFLEKLDLDPDPTENDADGDGVPDDLDAFPNDPDEWQDTDGDGVGDNADTDINGNGIPNKYEAITELEFEWGIIPYAILGLTILSSLIIIAVPRTVIQQKIPLLVIVAPIGAIATFLAGFFL